MMTYTPIICLSSSSKKMETWSELYTLDAVLCHINPLSVALMMHRGHSNGVGAVFEPRLFEFFEHFLHVLAG